MQLAVSVFLKSLITITLNDEHVTLLQAVGIIAAVGDSVTHLEIGTPAAIMTFGSYAEFMMVN